MAGRILAARSFGGSLVAAALVAGMVPQAAHAQIDNRLESIEAQLRALQRAVFPGGDSRFFEPEITANTAQPVQRPQAGVPSASALTDVLARLDAIEQQLARLTAATEVNENSLALLDMRVNEIEQARATTVAATPTPTPTPAPAQPTGVIPVGEGNELGGLASTVNTPAPAVAGPTPERLAGVQGITKPVTDDRGDDEYTYGFRLWDAGYYPEAQQQLAMFVEQYPSHWRTTYGRNLLGRAFLDAGDARRAATHFFENYQSDKQAARAADSLLYLAESMIELGDTRRACIALAEFGDTYPALATGRLQGLYDTSRGRVDCE
ncbi:tetratricopeptide repeat protein [Alteraurantiacibacter aquimixticola]|uniref:Tetratricopeptide repeat protein n=1 Tax=Alteraurantiacibacter aquimixticola TaxID=2489173 RepID=A0A4T3F1V6_9SPHN|nr:tetratricopeptide repeat protein [Alteraurantiacibacter aquimixticola]TIX51203.1 tetratricopeptide repeat protein [Alteraurantiacibacter aquimixticola]